MEHHLVLFVLLLLSLQEFRILVAAEAKLTNVVIEVLVVCQLGEVAGVDVAMVAGSLVIYSFLIEVDAAISSWSPARDLVVPVVVRILGMLLISRMQS